MSDEKIWAEGLLIFYEIFKFLEAAVARLSLKSHPTNQHFSRFKSIIAGIERTNAFEADLDFYFGPGYLKEYSIRPSVAEYLSHLQTLEEREPLRLMAYLYHLYMGLLSGGQILKRKRDLRNRFKRKLHSLFQWFGFGIPSSSGNSLLGTAFGQPRPGDAITYFGDGRTISDIKKEITFTMNDIASDLSTDEKNSLLEESLEVFRRNNEIVGSIQRTGFIALKNYAMFFIFITSIGTAMYWYMFYYVQETKKLNFI
jgi:heme oxygenase